jgi:hypothetical protein
MIYRCESPNCHQYANYGGRGVRVCDRWRHSFEAFLQDMGKSPSKKHSIDRIDVNGNYEPSNCRWVLPITQTRNRRSCRYIEIGGETKTMSEWCEIYNIDKATVSNRIARGWSEVDAITRRPKFTTAGRPRN